MCLHRPLFPEELLDRFLFELDPSEKDGRTALKTCRVVSRQFKRIVKPYVFRVVELQGEFSRRDCCFARYGQFAANPTNRHIATAVQELILTGGASYREGGLDWDQLFNIIRYCASLKILTLAQIHWTNWYVSPYHHVHHAYLARTELPRLLPHLSTIRFNRFQFWRKSLEFRTARLPPVLLTPTVTSCILSELAIDDVHPRGIATYTYHIPYVCIDAPSESTLRLLRDMEDVRHLEIWNIDDRSSEWDDCLSFLVEGNKQTLQTLVLDADFDTSGTQIVPSSHCFGNWSHPFT